MKGWPNKRAEEWLDTDIVIVITYWTFNRVLSFNSITSDMKWRLIFRAIKASNMKTPTIQQEILLSTSSSFSRRKWAKLAPDPIPLSLLDQLEEACWNGLARELLAETQLPAKINRLLWLREIKRTKAFLELTLCNFPHSTDEWYSIDPKTYLSNRMYNWKLVDPAWRCWDWPA